MELGKVRADPAGPRRLAIVAAADEAYAMPLAVTLSSALLRLPEDVVPELHVFDGGMSRASAARLARLVPVWHRRAELVLHPVSGGVLEGIDTGVYSPTVLLRVLIPEVVPEHHERVLYLDSDIVVERDLSPLWDLPMAGVPLHAVEDFPFRIYPEVVERVDRVARANGLGPGLRYFNSGVLLVNAPLWREEGLAAQMVHRLRTQAPGTMQYPDQDAMNVVLAGRWRELEPFWNFQALPDPRLRQELFSGERQWLLEAPKVIHYTSRKPWTRQSHAWFFRNFVRAYVRSQFSGPPSALAHTIGFFGRRLYSGLSKYSARAFGTG